MIQRKVFYSVIQVDGIVGIRKQDEYELRIDGEKFNAYQSIRDGRVYILDPQNGIALLIYNANKNEDELSEIEIIEKAKEKFSRSEALSRWKEMKKNESYRLTIKIFRAYRMAEKLRERQKEAVWREIEERRQRSSGNHY